MTDINHSFTFVDLFAGIGGFRYGLEKVGGTCLYSNERDPDAVKTYTDWHCKNGEKVDSSDFRKVKYATVPEHDILAAGFPCQPFSLAGVSKNNSLDRRHGLDHEEQGNLFEHIMKLVDSHGSQKGIKRPKVLFLENVKNLKSHNNGETWKEIKERIRQRGYHLEERVIDANRWVPQHRERVYMVCFDLDHFGAAEDINFSWEDMELPDKYPVLGDILEDMDGWTRQELDKYKKKYRISKLLWESHQRRLEENRKRNEFIDRYRRNHKKLLKGAGDWSDVEKREKFIDRYLRNHKKLLDRAPPEGKRGDETAYLNLDIAVKEALDSARSANSTPYRVAVDLNSAVDTKLPKKRGFGYSLAKADGQTRTLSARYHKDGAEILYKQDGWQRPRRLTPAECGRLMGFPDTNEKPLVSNTQAYRQYGNAVVPPVIEAIGEQIVKALLAASPPDEK
jgi:DNA-cytosine methyltransferase